VINDYLAKQAQTINTKRNVPTTYTKLTKKCTLHVTKLPA